MRRVATTILVALLWFGCSNSHKAGGQTGSYLMCESDADCGGDRHPDAVSCQGAVCIDSAGEPVRVGGSDAAEGIRTSSPEEADSGAGTGSASPTEDGPAAGGETGAEDAGEPNPDAGPQIGEPLPVNDASIPSEELCTPSEQWREGHPDFPIELYDQERIDKFRMQSILATCGFIFGEDCASAYFTVDGDGRLSEIEIIDPERYEGDPEGEQARADCIEETLRETCMPAVAGTVNEAQLCGL